MWPDKPTVTSQADSQADAGATPRAGSPVVPCSTCPWRRTSTVGGSDIDGFAIEMMRRLAASVGPDDDFRPIMACHNSGRYRGDPERPCIGYVHFEGHSNLTMRLYAIVQGLDWPAITEACNQLDLWPSFAAMLAAYEQALGHNPGPSQACRSTERDSPHR